MQVKKHKEDPKYRAEVALYKTTKEALKAAVVPKKLRDEADMRNKLLSGVQDWCNASSTPFHRASSCKSHDWKQLLQWSAGYVLDGLLPPHIEEAFFGLVEVVNKLLEANSNVRAGEEYERDEGLEQLKLTVVKALVALEECVPMTDRGPIIFHIIPHVVDSIYRWNSVRNFWAFFTERYIVIIVRKGRLEIVLGLT